VAECPKENAQTIQGRLSKLKKVSELKQTTNKSLEEFLFGKVDYMDMCKAMNQKS
jgi:hypothetical protein